MALFSDQDLSLLSGKDAAPAPKAASNPDVEAIIRRAAEDEGVGQYADLLVGIAKTESGLDPAAQNPETSAGGLFQFVDDTARRYDLKDRFDPQESASKAARMFRDHLDALGDPMAAVAAHHVGQGRAKQALQDAGVGDVNISTQDWMGRVLENAGVRSAEPTARRQPWSSERPTVSIENANPWDSAPTLISAGLDAGDAPPEDVDGATLGDLGRSALSTVGRMVASTGWGFEKLTGYGKFVETVGTDLAEWAEAGMSERMKAARGKSFITEEEGEDGVEYGMGDAWTDPWAIAGVMVEGVVSLIPMVGAAGTASLLAIRSTSAAAAAAAAKEAAKRGLAGAAAKDFIKTETARVTTRAAARAGMLAGGSMEGWLEGTGSGQEVGEEVRGMEFKELAAYSQDYRAMVDSGASPEEAREEVARLAENQAAQQAGLIAAGTGAVLGHYVGKAAAGRLPEWMGKTRLGRAGTAAAGEGAQEAFQEGSAEAVGNKAIRDYADERQRVFEDVPDMAVRGAIGGAPIGGALGAVGGGEKDGADAPPAGPADITPPVPPREDAPPPPNSPLSAAVRAATDEMARTPRAQPSEFDVRLQRVADFVDDKEFMQGLRGSQEYGAQSVAEIMTAFSKARSPEVDQGARDQALTEIEQFIDDFVRSPNFASRKGMVIDAEARPASLPSPDQVSARRNAEAAYEQAYQDLVKAEQLGASDVELMEYRQALDEAQAALDELNAGLADVAASVEGGRREQELARRREIIDRVLSDTRTINPRQSITQALSREGVRQLNLSPEEDALIERFENARRAEEQPNVEPAADNEFDPYEQRAERQTPSARSTADKVDEVRGLIGEGWRLQNRTLVSPKGKRRNLNQMEYAAAREAARRVSEGLPATEPQQDAQASQAPAETSETAQGADDASQVEGRPDQEAGPAGDSAEVRPAEGPRVSQPPIGGTYATAELIADAGLVHDAGEYLDARRDAGTIMVAAVDRSLEQRDAALGLSLPGTPRPALPEDLRILFLEDPADDTVLPSQIGDNEYVVEWNGATRKIDEVELDEADEVSGIRPLILRRDETRNGVRLYAYRVEGMPDDLFDFVDAVEQAYGQLAEATQPLRPSDPGVAAMYDAVRDAELKTDAEPTDSEKEAGTYTKGEVEIHGQTVAVETARGELRTGVDADGNAWSVRMPVTYGEFVGTMSADGDAVDVFVGPNPQSGLFWIVNQVRPGTLQFDEPKVMLGFDMGARAAQAYKDSFADDFGDQVFGDLVGPFSVADLAGVVSDLTRKSATKPPKGIAGPAVPGRLQFWNLPEYAGTNAVARMPFDVFRQRHAQAVGEDASTAAEIDALRADHMDAIESALARGERVPQPVVSEYKDVDASRYPMIARAANGYDTQSDQFRRYFAWIDARDARQIAESPGTLDQIRTDPRLFDGEAQALENLWASKLPPDGGIDAPPSVVETTADGAAVTAPDGITAEQRQTLNRRALAYRGIIPAAGEAPRYRFRSTADAQRFADDPAVQEVLAAPAAPVAQDGWRDNIIKARLYATALMDAGQISDRDAIQAVWTDGEALVDEIDRQMEGAETSQEAEPQQPAEETAGEDDAGRRNAETAERNLFDALAADADIVAFAANESNSLDHFQIGAEGRVGPLLAEMMESAADGGDMDLARALSELLADGRPVLPQDFYKGLRDAILQARREAQRDDVRDGATPVLAAAMARAGYDPQSDAGRQYVGGWEHALAGKTKSTLPGGKSYQDGYAAARDWMTTTPEGRAAASGRRANKLKNTGAELRRWFDRARESLRAEESDADAFVAMIERVTTRADLLKNVIPEDATPGTHRWFASLRSLLPTFSDFLYYGDGPLIGSNSRRGRRYGRDTLQDYITGRADLSSRYKRPSGGGNNPDTPAERMDVVREIADTYVGMIEEFAAEIQGADTVESATQRLTDALVNDYDNSWEFSAYAFATGDRQAVLTDLFRRLDGSTSINYRKLAGHMMRPKSDFWRQQNDSRQVGYISEHMMRAENETQESTRKKALRRPRLDSIERDGEDFRSGQDVSPEQFKEELGFADVGFGKWVAARQDQDHLNYAYDAFRDLAGLLGVPPQALSMGGRLHFTIGALGHGKHAAHYNAGHPHPDGGTVPVINVTNTKGDGTVAHEWGHALDLTKTDNRWPLDQAIQAIKADLRYAYDYDVVVKGINGFLRASTYWRNDKRSSNVREGRIEGASRAIDYYADKNHQASKFLRAARELDGNPSKDGKYWSNDKEPFARAFEAWAADRLDGRSDYLVNGLWVGDGAITKDAGYRGTPYPEGEERQRFNEWFDALAKSLRYEGGELTLDPVAWETNRPRHRDQWNQRLNELRDSLESRLDMIEAEDRAKVAALEMAREEARQLKVGDVVERRDQSGGHAGVQYRVTGVEPRSENDVIVVAEAIGGTARGSEYRFWGAAVRLLSEAEPAPPTAPPPAPEPASEPAGEMTTADYEKLFDEAAAELAEEQQEQPEAPPPGGNNAPAPAYTAEDVAALVEMIDGGQIVLLADAADTGIPTIHDVEGSRHMGLGVFQAVTDAYEIDFTAGGAMQRLPGGKGYTVVNVTRGEFPYDSDAILKRLRGKTESRPAVGDHVDRTAGKMAAEAAKLGVSGVDEALKGLVKLFGGGPGRLSSFPGGFDEDTYRQAKPHFQAALKNFQDAGRTLKDLIKFIIGQFGLGVKPYIVRFAKEQSLSADLAEKPSAAMRVADFVRGKLDRGEKFTSRELYAEADIAFEGTQADGVYSPKDAYDAMEAGVNRWLLSKPGINASGSADAARAAVARMKSEILDRLPTQTRRDGETDEFQQFSTPPTLAYVASWVANVNAADTVMEPSAGTGDLAVYAHNAGARLILNELSPRRHAILKDLFPAARLSRENAEQIDNILPADVVPTVVIMNPPFSATAGRKAGSRSNEVGQKHVTQALKRLAAGGRLVAILGDGAGYDKPGFRSWYNEIQKSYNVRAVVGVDGSEYAKYGTTFDNVVIVIDKDGPQRGDVLTARVDSVEELPQLLGGIRNARPQVSGEGGLGEPGADQQGGDGVAATDDVAPDAGGTDGSNADGVRGGRGSGRRGAGGSGGTSRGGRSGAGGRTGGGNRSEPGGDAAGSRADADSGTSGQSGSDVALSRQDRQERAGELTDSVFEQYQPQKVKIDGAVEHPAELVESAAMSAVEPPDPSYVPNLPKSVIESGQLSDAQLEAIVYAGQAHQETLPSGERRGFFIGDGTGVGKGREISGILLDNFRRGRRKAVWVSKTGTLFGDAKRDFGGVGGDVGLLFQPPPASGSISRDTGILFTTYSTLRSAQRDTDGGATKGKSRIDQLVDWLGDDFDGVIAFDESHMMANSVEEKGLRGTKKPSRQALAGIELQRRLPDARIVYVSATGATEVGNLAYATRLGLWGEGTSFANVSTFISKIAAGGVAAMELVSRDMKAMGMYIARSLSYNGVEYRRLEHELTDIQRDIYDELARTWQVVLQNIDSALGESGQGNDSQRKSAVLSQFWGTHQRFFNQIITAMMTPSAIEDMRAQIDAGNSVVVQLVNTGEAEQKRQLARNADEDADLEELDFTPRQALIEYVRNGFPVAEYEEVSDGDNTFWQPALDSDGNPIVNRDLVRQRDALIETLNEIRVPGNPLDEIIEALGAENVAEYTGRGKRLVREVRPDGSYRMVEQKRSKNSSVKESQEFQDGKRRTLIFSQAGGTGASFHADNKAKNRSKRIHYILQPGWRADSAVQGFGRTHRSDQAQPPEYVLMTTDLRAQKRFVSSIARRLDQLGALTRGQRDAGSQGLFSAADNLESEYAVDAMKVFFNDLFAGRVNAMSFDDLTAEMGLNGLVDDNNQLIQSKIPTVQRFLNRLLSLTYDRQSEVFEQFEARLVEIVEIAKQRGTYDLGMETLRANRVEVEQDEVVHVDERTGAETRYVELAATNPVEYAAFDEAEGYLRRSSARAGNGDATWHRVESTGKVFGLARLGTRTGADGKTVSRGAIHTISGITYTDIADTIISGRDGRGNRVEVIDKAVAEELWAQAIELAPKELTRPVHIVTGAVLPIWDRLPGDPRVVRAQTTDGQRLIGRIIPATELKQALLNLGVGSRTSKMSAAQILDALRDGQIALMSNGWRIKKARVSNEDRFEIEASYIGRADSDLLESQGVFSERIAWQQRYFIPSGARGEEVLARIMKSKDVVDLLGADGSDTPSALSRRAATEGGVTRDQVEEFVAKTAEALPGMPVVRVVQTFGDLPERMQRDARDQRGTPETVMGVFDNAERVAYIVSANHNTMADVEATLYHEAIGHGAMRQMLGENFVQELNRLYVALGGQGGLVRIMNERGRGEEAQGYLWGFIQAQQAERGRREAAVRAGREAPAARYTDETVRALFTEEVFAHISETRPNLRDKFMELLGRLRAWIKKHFPRAARQFMPRAGVSDMLALLHRARSQVHSGDTAVMNDVPGVMARRTELGYYSGLAAAFEAARQESMPAGQWLAWLDANAAKMGVKKDEIEWSGVREWLQMQPKNKVSRDDIVAFVEQGGVRVEEVSRGSKTTAGLEALSDDDLIAEYERIRGYEPRDTYGDAMTREAIVDELSTVPVEDTTRYSEYTVPGGENYREVLLTLPDGRAAAPAQMERPQVRDRGHDENGRGQFDVVQDGAVIETHQTWSAAQDRALEIEQDENIRRNIAWEKDRPPTYKSTHWPGVANVVAHLRVDDRVGAGGESVLFVNEIQSDWAQEGRAEGFRTEYDGSVPEVTAKVITGREFVAERGMTAAEAADWLDGKNAMRGDLEMQALSLDDEFTVVYEDGEPVIVRNGANDPEQAAAQRRKGRERIHQEQRLRHENAQADMKPRAPFVADTKSWVSLAVKRAITMAAEGGYDQVAFISGDQAAGLYDLSKQVKEVIATKDGDDYYISASDLKGRTIDALDNAKYSAEELPGVLGKDLADKIVSDGGGIYTGVDLKVGGEGMRAFYDKIVPQVVADVLKKIGGGKVVDVTLPHPSQNDGISGAEVMQALGRNEEEWSQLEQSERDRLIEEVRNSTVTQKGFDITPAMRERVIADGLPLFSRTDKPVESKGMTAAEFRAAVVERYGEKSVETLERLGLFNMAPPSGRPRTHRAWYSNGSAFFVPEFFDSKQDAIAAVLHEIGEHHGLQAMIGDRGWQAIKQRVADLAGRDDEVAAVWAGVRRMYADVAAENPGDLVANDRFMHEVVAKIGETAAGRKTGIWREILMRVNSFLLKFGFARQINKNELADLVAGSLSRIMDGGPGGPGGMTLDQRRDVTDTPEFRSWFGDSKVVDENGDPMVVYHGTNGNFDSFDPLRSEVGIAGEGFYFTNDPDSAEEYADGDGGNIMPVFLSINSPASANDLRRIDRLVENGEIAEEDIREVLEGEGFDGLILRDGGDEALYVAFYPEQIKSATGNRGTFDAGSPNIMEQRAFNVRDYMPGRGLEPNSDSEYAEQNRRFREEHVTVMDKAKSWLRRQFSPGGNLPDSVFDEKITRDNNMEVIEFDVSHAVGALERAVREDYGLRAENLDAEVQRLLSAVMAGNIDASVPENTRVALVAMRNYIDTLSEEYIAVLSAQVADIESEFDVGEQELLRAFVAMDDIQAEGDRPADKARATRERNRILDEAKESARALWAANGQANKNMRTALGRVVEAADRIRTIRTIQGNIGEYVHRSYRAFDDPKWFSKIPDAVLDNARRYLMSRLAEQGELDAEGIADRVEAIMEEIVKHSTAYDSMDAFVRESKLGAKDLSVLQRRKQIAPEIRALLGEHIDPRVNFAKSATKMGRLIWNQRFLDRVREVGMGVFLWEDGKQPTGATAKIAGDASEVFAPLNGLWTTPEINQAFVDALGKEQMEDWYRLIVKTNGMIKYGKAQPLDATVYTPGGPMKMGDIEVGQQVLGVNGPTAVLGIFPQGEIDVYRVTFADGSHTEASADHLWEVVGPKGRQKYHGLFTTKQIKAFKGDVLKSSSVPVAAADFDARPVRLDPYVLGAILGDGGLTTSTVRFTKSDPDMVSRIRDRLPDGVKIESPPSWKDNEFAVTALDRSASKRSGNPVMDILRELGLMGSSSLKKFIPDDYRYNTRDVRIELIRGLLDTDGTVDRVGQPVFNTSSERLAADFREVAESLGATVLTRTKQPKGGALAYELRVRTADAPDWFWLPRKKSRASAKKKPVRRMFRSIEHVGTKPCQCILVEDARHLYLTDRFIVTHNTVLSPTTAARNWMSAFFFAVANGHSDMSHMKKSVDGLREYFTHAGSAEKLAYLRELKALGVVYDTPYAGEMIRLLEDSRLADSLSKGGKNFGLKSALDYATKFYQYGDDFWKIIGFENEKRLWMSTGLSEQDAKVKAAERVRNTYPTYSMVGRAIKQLRRFPLAGTFVSFPAEIIRTTYNMVRYIREDMKDPKTRPLAIRRAVGLSIVSGFAFAAQRLSMLLLGFDDDDDEAVRQMAAPWQKNSSFIFFGRDDDGNIRYLDISFLDPYNYWKRPLMAVMRDQPADDAIKDSIGELVSPFLGSDIAAENVFQVLANQKSSGAPVYREYDDPLDQTVDIANHLYKALRPGILSNMHRTWDALSGEVSPSGRSYNVPDELAAWVGFRMTTLDPKVALYYRSFEFKDAKSQAEQKLRAVIRDPGDVSDSELRNTYELTVKLRTQAYEQMHVLVNAARKSGLSNGEIAGALRNAGVSAMDAGLIVRGITPPWRPNKTTVRQVERKAARTFGRDAATRVRDRYRDLERMD